MSVNIIQIQDALFDWANNVLSVRKAKDINGNVLDVNVFWREQGAPTPKRPSVGLKILSGPDRVGSFDNVCDAGDGENVIVGGHRVMTISVQTYGCSDISNPFSYQAAVDLHASLTRPTVLEGLRANGISIHDIGVVQDISFVEETEYEERASLEIRIGVASNVEDQPSFIEEVKTINGTF